MYIFEANIFGINISPTWYGLMYALSFLIGYALIKRQKFSEKNLEMIFTATILGVIVGGRLGYVFFYNPVYFLSNILEIFMPWKGGMSFHGGAIGVIVAWYICAKKMRVSFLGLSDSLAWIIPIGLFFGRIGNYINGELLGMAGYAGLFARTVNGVSYFPTPLLESILEGLVLFLVLIWRKKNISYPGQVGIWFLSFYALFRFGAEFFRSPDSHIGYIFGGWMTYGHLLSIIMFFVAVIIGNRLKNKLTYIK